MANVINKSHPVILRAAGHHQTDTGLFWVPPQFWSRFSQDSPLAVQREGIGINRFEIENQTAGNASVGVGFRLHNRHWRMGRLSADGATYTDLTATAQSPTATVTLQATGADQTGFAIGCLVPFDWASVNITTAETDNDGGNEIDHDVYYSIGAGWSAALGAVAGSVATTNDFYCLNSAALWTAVVKNFVWRRPTAWTVSAALGGLPDGYYWLRFTSADREALDVAAIATGIEIGTLASIRQLATMGIWEQEIVDFWEPKADGLVGYFSVANGGNRIYTEVESR